MEKLLKCMKEKTNIININEEIADKARFAINKMLSL
jgi:quinolinate synthase